MKHPLIYVMTLWKVCQFMYWHYMIMKGPLIYVLTLWKTHRFMYWHYEKPTNLCIDIIMKDLPVYVLTSLWKRGQPPLLGWKLCLWHLCDDPLSHSLLQSHQESDIYLPVLSFHFHSQVACDQELNANVPVLPLDFQSGQVWPGT